MLEVIGSVWSLFWGLLLNVLVGINTVVHNPGVSIIIFTLFMRLLTVPLTVRALKSSRNMQQIQPLIKEIQKKYPKDRQKQQEETMKLYSEYGVNPAASCFPMLIQMPIFFGLYSALQFTISHGTDAASLNPILWNNAWLPWANFDQPFLWLSNLAATDPLHIWPILSGVFQFLQSRMSIPARDPNQVLDSQQKMMQNLMQFMPLYIVFISWSFPAGTVVYWAFSSLFGAVQQYFITGFGTLPDLPGLGFLPRKQIEKPQAPMPRLATADGTGTAAVAKRSGVMSWMMNKALEAQDAQKLAQETQGADGSTGKGSAGSNGAKSARVVSEQPVKGKGSVYGSAGGSRQAPRETAGNGAKYASDRKYRPSAEGLTGNGAGSADDVAVQAPLPRKKKSKR